MDTGELIEKQHQKKKLLEDIIALVKKDKIVEYKIVKDSASDTN